MKLRRPCEHDHYEEHPCIDGKWVSQMRMLRITDKERSLLSMCPGGVFLPDDTLTDAAWQFNEAVSMLREIRGAVVGIEDVREIDEALPAMQSALEALALSVREAETEVDKNQMGMW